MKIVTDNEIDICLDLLTAAFPGRPVRVSKHLEDGCKRVIMLQGSNLIWAAIQDRNGVDSWRVPL